MVDNTAAISMKMGMQMNAAEKELIQFLDKGEQKFSIHFNCQQLTQTDNFVYFGGVINTHWNTEADVAKRNIARNILRELDQVWNFKDINCRNTKIRVFEALILSTLLYNSETRTLLHREEELRFSKCRFYAR